MLIYFIKNQAKLQNYLLALFIFFFTIANIYSWIIKNFTTTFYLYFVDFFLILFLINISKESIKKVINNKLFLSVIIFSFLLLLSYLWSTEKFISIYGNSHHYIHFYFYYFIAPFVFFTFLSDKKYITLFISSFLWAMFINELLSYGVHFGLFETTFGTQLDPVPFHFNHITYSTYSGFAILLSIYRFIHVTDLYKKIIYLLFFTSLTINLFLSAGRTGQFSLFITLLFLFVIYFRKKLKVIFLSFLLLISIFFTAYKTSDTFHTRVNHAISDTKNAIINKNFDTSFGTRLAALYTPFYLINKNNFLLGVGVGDKPEYIKTTLKKSFPYRVVAFHTYGYLHNSHIEIFVSIGLVGFILYLSIFYFLLSLKTQNKDLKYLATITPIYFFFVGFTTDLFFWHHITLLLASLLGIVSSQTTNKNK